MKFHRNLINAVVKGLSEILLLNKQADTTVENILQSNKGWGSRDRAFIADNIYTIVRYKRLYEFCSDAAATNNEALFKLLAAKLILQGIELPDWDEFKGVDATAVLAKKQEAEGITKIRESIPDWLDDLGQAQLGDSWPAEINALNQPAKFSIRINTLRTTKAALLAVFDKEGIAYIEVPGEPDALIIAGKKNFRNHFTYSSGWFEIQDASSQLVAPFLDVKEGMQVIDACAGGGGKTLHVAALMRNKGKITALDINARKLEDLKRRAQRGGVNILTVNTAEPETIELLANSADRLLLDVPCSGTGVLRRKPDAKWKLSAAFIEEIKQTQAGILDNYTTMLKPGGILVYSTCSILPAENKGQISSFLQRNKEFQLLDEKSVSPAQSGFDGFYMAKLKRKG
ncbi:MAG: methyltransferase domain-containing protein [Chitinophagales bacterium]